MTKLLTGNRNLRLFWLSHIVGMVANEFYNLAAMVSIYEQTQSALQTTGVIVARTLSGFLFGAAAGVVADRYSRKHVMLSMTLARALLVGVLSLIDVNDGQNLWLIYGMLFCISSVTTIFTPAQMSSIPTLVPRSELVQANNLLKATTQAAFAAAYAVGGAMMLAIGFQNLMYIVVGLYVVSAVLLASLHLSRPSDEADGQKESLRESLVAGVRFTKNHKLTRALVVMETIEAWPNVTWNAALMLAFIQDALHGDAALWGYQVSVYCAGQLCTGVVIAVLATKIAPRAGWVIIASSLSYALLTFAYASAPTAMVAIIMAFAFGPAVAIRDVTQDAALQDCVDPKLLGRVYALRQMLNNFCRLLGGILFGWLADQIHIRNIYVIAGVLYVLSTGYAWSSAALRQCSLAENSPKPSSS